MNSFCVTHINPLYLNKNKKPVNAGLVLIVPKGLFIISIDHLVFFISRPIVKVSMEAANNGGRCFEELFDKSDNVKHLLVLLSGFIMVFRDRCLNIVSIE